MATDTVYWLQIGAALVGGGLAGSLVTLASNNYRTRIQPIGYRITRRTLYRGDIKGNSVQAKISLVNDGDIYTYNNLYMLDLEIINTGNQDKASFPFGLTLGIGEKAVHTVSTSTDRHHEFILDNVPSPTNTRTSIDCRLTPFNRGDRYFLTVYTVLDDQNTEPLDVSIGSREAVKFVTMPTIGERLSEIAIESALLSIGPIKLRFPERRR